MQALGCTAITPLLESGAGPRTVVAIVGHADPTITLRLYTHSRAEGRKAALMQVATGFEHLIPDIA